MSARYTTGSGLNRVDVDGRSTRRGIVAKIEAGIAPMERPEGEPPLWLGVLIMFAGVAAIALTVLLFSEYVL